MATYNGERFIREQLDSLAAQTRSPDELVVTDDGSTDRTLEIVDDFSRSAPFSVRVYRNGYNLGSSENFLKAAGLCTGDWIAFCDQDDVWLPKKLATVEQHIKKSGGDVLLVVHSADVVDESLAPSGIRHPDIRRYRKCSGHQLPTLWFVAGFTMIFRSDFVSVLYDQNRGPGHNLPVAPLAHDAWVCWLACILGEVIMLPDSLALYRRHGATTTTTLRGGNHEVRKARRISQQIKHVLTMRGADVYSQCSQALLHQAMALGRLGHASERNEWREKLLHAETHYKALSNWLAERARLYEETTCLRRFGRLWRLVCGGGYVQFQRSPLLVARSLAKDSFVTVVGSQRLSKGKRTQA